MPERASEEAASPYKTENHTIKGRNVRLCFYNEGDGSVTCEGIRGGFHGYAASNQPTEDQARASIIEETERGLDSGRFSW